MSLRLLFYKDGIRENGIHTTSFRTVLITLLTEMVPLLFSVGLTTREACNKCFVIVYVITEQNLSRL